MFSLSIGPLNNYRKELIKELSIVDNSKYIFNIEVGHFYDNSDFETLTEHNLQNELNKYLESINSHFKIIKIIDLKCKWYNGYPKVLVQNTKTMTLCEFLNEINIVYFNETIDYIIDECLDQIYVVKES